MDHTESFLIKLKRRFGKFITDYQSKSDSILDNLKNYFDDFKGKFTKLESDLVISTNVNSKLSDRLLNVERKSFANEQYSRTN